MSPLCQKSERDSAIGRTLFVHLVRSKRSQATTRWGIIMAQGRNFVTALMVGTASISMIVAGTTVPAVAQAATGNYKIDSQPLSQALMQLSRQANVDIVAPAKIVRGRTGKAVAAESVDVALRQMLAGSGLSYKISGKRYVIQSGNVQGGASQPASAPARSAAAESPGVVAAPSASASTVVDARTGAALKGALVEIVETGEKTSTGELGEFRFPGKTGSFNLRISYLGYPEYQQNVDLKDGRSTSGILLSDGGASSEIVVTAYQSARAQALNQERTSENTSTVVSADLLGQFDGNTISDALRRVPGVAFRVNESTGDGTNIIVRGLPSSFNTVTLNGLRLPVGDGLSRSPDLSNILADSVSKITLNKTLLPSQDGSGTGALVEIETKGPLDRPRRYFNLGVEKALTGENFLNETALSGTASFAFGPNKNFGLSASIQYRKRQIDSVRMAGELFFGQYLPAESAGNPVFSTDDIDPSQRFPFEPSANEIYGRQFDVGQNSTRVENLTIGVSAQWRLGEHTEIKADYNRLKAKSSGYTRNRSLNVFYGYEILPVAELNGELRSALVWENAFGQAGLPISSTQTATLNPGTTNITEAYSLKGETIISRLTISYNTGYTKASYEAGVVGMRFLPATGLSLDETHLLADVAGNRIDGRIVSPFLPASHGAVSLPGLSSAGYDLINNAASYRAQSITSNFSSGGNQRLTAALNVKYDFESPILKYLQTGIFYESSKSDTRFEGSTAYRLVNPPKTMADIGLGFDGGILDRIGMENSFPVTSASSLIGFYNQVRNGLNPLFAPFPFKPDPLDSENGTTEHDLAGYVQAYVKLGKLDIIGGIRAEQVKTKARSIVSPFLSDENGIPDQEFINANLKIIELSGTDLNILPRVTLNYRFNDNLILRTGYYLSIARPSIQELNSGVSISLYLDPNYGPNENQPILWLSSGNPDLKAALTHNFDVSLEWYSDDIGAIKLGAFYKPTKNAFFSSTQRLVDGPPDEVILPDDPRFQNPNLFIEFTKPQNNPEQISIFGVEASIEKKLSFLPGMMRYFGVFANGTYTRSSRDIPVFYSYVPGMEVIVGGVPYADSPKYSGTFALTYDNGNFSGALSYTKQARLLVDFSARGLSRYRGAIDSLDFRASYQANFGSVNSRFYIEGSNLLKGPSDSNSENYMGGARVLETYLGGRSIRFGVSASF